MHGTSSMRCAVFHLVVVAVAKAVTKVAAMLHPPWRWFKAQHLVDVCLLWQHQKVFG
jgi:hypothetical protein